MPDDLIRAELAARIPFEAFFEQCAAMYVYPSNLVLARGPQRFRAYVSGIIFASRR